MAPATASYISVCAVAFICFAPGVVSQQHFLERVDPLSVDDMYQRLHEFVEVAHSGGNTPLAKRLIKIEVSIARSYQALAKNAAGRLSPRSVRYLVHNYFAKEHGWQIKGLEPDGLRTNVSEVHDVHILQDKAPALVEALLEAQQSNRGLGLEDVAAMVALLERMILDESSTLLEASYFLNGYPSDGLVDEDMLHEILRSYLLLTEMGMRSNLTDADKHQKIKSKVAAKGSGWPAIVEFESDTVFDYQYQQKDMANPFREELFNFPATQHLVEELAQGYGKWQNDECSRMKRDLMDMDRDGSGRIPMTIFYAKSKTRDYQFTESLEYLREIGAIDETTPREPSVRLANYVSGPSNCIASSAYYSICCLNECDQILNELEGSIQAPVASPEFVLKLVSNLTSASMLAPKEVLPELQAKLFSIAEVNDGQVPLHGRLFAQWLHFTFPYECPFPHVAQEADTLSAARWVGGKAIAPKEVRQDLVDSLVRVDDTIEDDFAAHPSLVHWSHEEVLPLHHTPQHKPSIFGGSIRIGVQLAMFLVLLRAVIAGCFAAARAGKGEMTKSKAEWTSSRSEATFV